MPLKSRIRRPFLLLLCILVLSGCARNPVTGKRQIVLISESQEIAYGREAHPEVLAQFGRVEDSDLQNYFNEIGQELAVLSHRPELKWHFNVVDSPIINAFALPGGYIYFTREILAYMNNEAELAGVMGHEIGHVTARHSVSQISKSQLFGVGLGLGSVLSPTFSQLSEFAQVGVGMLSLKYGRDDERQSDELGVKYMSLGGYDPRELSKFFVVFQQMRENSSQSIPDWLSSHPAPPDRITATRQDAETLVRAQPEKRWIINRESFLRRISGSVFGKNPREGFRSDGWFVHPDLEFRIRIPTGWRVRNSKKAVVSAPASEDAAIQLTLAEAPEGTSPRDYARSLIEQSGVELLEGENTRINGYRAFIGTYRFQDSQGNRLIGLAAIIHKFGVSVDFLRKFRAESVFRCDYKASKLVEPNRDEARAPSGNSSARRGLYICVGAGSQGTVRWDTDGASVMRRAFVRDKTMPGAPRCDEKFPEPGHRF